MRLWWLVKCAALAEFALRHLQNAVLNSARPYRWDLKIKLN